MKVFTPVLPQTTTQMFTPSQTDMADMVRRAMKACDDSRAFQQEQARLKIEQEATVRQDRAEAAFAANHRHTREQHGNKLVRAGTRNGNPFL